MSSGAPRNLVLCSDGTGQKGGKTRTNVWRIYQAIDRTSTDPEQMAFYEDGVGSEDFKLIKLIGKATGMGLSANIRDLYRWLMLNYRKGDRIFLFGFSRGAYTVRSFAGLLRHSGLVLGDKLDASHAEAVAKEVYNDYYRGKVWRRLLRWLPMAQPSRRALPNPFSPKKAKLGEALEVVHPEIWFLGVWDTVGAVGVPGWLLAILTPLRHILGFHDINANNWWNAYHAVAVDDERRSFWPQPLPAPAESAAFELTDGRRSLPPEIPSNGTRPGSDTTPRVEVDQVLFPGAHSNVGGGYPKDGLAFNALDWIATKARNKGLEITAEARSEVRHRKNAHDRIYDPRSGLAAFYRYAPRDFGRIERVYKRRYKADGHQPLGMHRVHEAVFDRIARSTAGYGPKNLPDGVEVTATGKDADGELRHDERERVVEYGRRLALADRAQARKQTLDGVRGPVWIRKTLYWLLIGFTVGLLADVIWLLDHQNSVPEAGAAQFAVPQPADLTAGLPQDGASAIDRPPLSWVASLGSLFLPKAAEQLTRQLLAQAWDYWRVSVPILTAFVLVLWWRQRLKKRCEQLGLKGWHTFRSPPDGAEPITVAVHGTGSGE